MTQNSDPLERHLAKIATHTWVMAVLMTAAFLLSTAAVIMSAIVLYRGRDESSARSGPVATWGSERECLDDPDSTMDDCRPLRIG